MSRSGVHISVCVCTYKRPLSLRDLLAKLVLQRTAGLFSWSVVVVDNDHEESARRQVESISLENPGLIDYDVEPEQNIALARNRAVARCNGELVAFIDDDEIPGDDWLLLMYSVLLKYRSDGVLGPVKARFINTPPAWMVKAGLFDRTSHETGHLLTWRQTRTGNALIRREVLGQVEGPFRKEFGSGGEDRDYFKRAISLGKSFVWCNEAIVYEIIPPERVRLPFQIRRAMLRGKASLARPDGGGFDISKSLIAIIIYTLLLPLFLVVGRHVFTRFLIKDCDHIGRLLAVCGIDVIKDKYVLK